MLVRVFKLTSKVKQNAVSFEIGTDWKYQGQKEKEKYWNYNVNAMLWF